MLRRFIFCSIASLLFCSVGFSQEEVTADAAKLDVPSNVKLSPEMYIYLRETERNMDPRNAVRKNAEARAAQRRNRVAALNWFGFSNSRPQASPTPFMGSYSPTWVSNSWDPYAWAGVGGGPVHVYYHGN